MSSFHFLTLESIQILSAGLYVAHQKGTYQIFGNVCCPILPIVLMRPRAIDMALVQPSGRYIEEKQTELETESK